MKPIIKLAALLLIMGSLASCEKELMTYEGEPVIYFAESQKQHVQQALVSKIAYDTAYVTFAYSIKMDSLRAVPVAISGKPVHYDRVFKVAINAQSTGIEGVHFEKLPENLIIPADAVQGTIPLKLLRAPDLLTKTATIILDLVPNENFGTNVKTRNISYNNSISSISFRIRVDDKLKVPLNWAPTFYGTFSRKKLFLVCELCNVTPAYLDTKTVSPGEVKFYAKFTQRYLNEQKAAGNTIYEEDGKTEMKMGLNAQ